MKNWTDPFLPPTFLVFLAFTVHQGHTQDTLQTLAKLVEAEPKPFVIMEATGQAVTNRSQGVVISPSGLVLSVGHVAWIGSENYFTDKFRTSFRGTGEGLPAGVVHVHKAVFTDRENEPFFEHYYPATLLMHGGTRFLGKGDLALYQIQSPGPFPKVDFFSKSKPTLSIGETLHLCHFSFPHKAGDPFFLLNPVEVVGLAKTSNGTQYLAQGYYRIGSSGGAILKDGRLLGIQSSAYTVNATGVGEIPLGLISFELVWEDRIFGCGNGAKRVSPRNHDF
jgi:hypothetical protein